MGRRNPIPEFVVAPKIVMASPMLGIASDNPKLIRTITKVAKTFYLELSLWSGAKKSSSMVSLHGKMVSGVANRITVRMPKREMKLTVMSG